MSRSTKVLISGAGLGGLTAALALLRRGIDVDVFEQAPVLQEIGAGVQLGPNGTRTLFSLGLEQEIRSYAFEPTKKELRLWDTGTRRKLFDVGAVSMELYGFPYLTMHRADLHDILVRAVRQHKPDAIKLNARGMQFSQSDVGVELQLENGTVAKGDVLIGADGLHSRIRQQLFGAAEAKFSGGICWRGLIPVDKIKSQSTRGMGATWIGPVGHVVTYSVRRGELINMVGHIESDNWLIESWTEPGKIEDLRADFAGWHPEVQELIENIESPFKWALFLRDPLQQWTVGRVSLLGDACHPTLPYLAQGANMAIEDGLVLARCLEKYQHDLPAALVHYQNARVDRTTLIVKRSAENLNRFHNPALADPVSAQQYMDQQWDTVSVSERYDWLFKYDAREVPV